MPYLDGATRPGYSALQPHLPVAYMSGHGSAVTGLLPLDLLHNCFIAEPFSQEAVLALIRKYVESRLPGS